MEDSKSVWRGVLIEESLEDKGIMDNVRIVGMRTSLLESEEYKGVFHFHNLEVPSEQLDAVLNEMSRAIKAAWYFHLVGGDVMKVVFKDKIFTLKKGDSATLASIQRYGQAHGVHPDQLQLEGLFDNPYGG